MAGDPIAVIVAVIVSAAGAVAATDLPPQIHDGAAGVAAAAEESAPGLQKQMDDLLGTLPEPARETAETMLDDAATAVENAVEPMLPPQPETPIDPEAAVAEDGSVPPAPAPASTPVPEYVPATAVSSFAPAVTGAMSAFSGVLQFGTSTFSLGDLASQTAFMPAAESLRRALFPGMPATFTGVELGRPRARPVHAVDVAHLRQGRRR